MLKNTENDKNIQQKVFKKVFVFVAVKYTFEPIKSFYASEVNSLFSKILNVR